MKMTFYGQFVAGEDQEAIKPLIRRNRAFGVGAVLDYSVEEDLSAEEAERQELESCTSAAEKEIGGAEQREKQYRAHPGFGDRRGGVISARTYFYADEAKCDQHMETFLRCIDASTAVLGGAGQVAEVLPSDGCGAGPGRAGSTGDAAGGRKAAGGPGQPRHRDQGRDPALVHRREPGHKRTGQLEPLLSRFTEEEDLQMKRMLQRMDVLAKVSGAPMNTPHMSLTPQRATEAGVRLMVDAEQSYFQPAISRLTLEMQRRFNRDRAIIFNTYQCYLKEAYDNVTVDVELSHREGWHFGTKLVRGAYMDQERERAAQIGYEDPINPTYEKTNEMYHRCLDYILEEIKHSRKANVMVASHNEDTVKFTLRRMMELGIHPSEKKVYFGQLLGMCDQITFPLGQAGFPVYKYVPYGPVQEVLPYLSRRAQENRGFMERANRERDLLWREVKRRLLAGTFFSSSH
ncbi:proline dehydrogenase 1, mitochondrial isoform 3-T3 [Amazona ochrocephala]